MQPRAAGVHWRWRYRTCAALPDYDTRSPDEILGYNEHGRPLLFKGDDFSRTNVAAAV